MKKSTKVHLFFGLDCRMIEFITNEPQSKEQLMPLPYLWNTGLAKKIAALANRPWTEQAGGLDLILHEAAQDFEVF